MKSVGNIWYVPMSDLVDKCGVGYRAIEEGYRRGSSIWQSRKDPEDSRRRLIRYDTLAPMYQNLVRAVLCGGMEPSQFKLAQQGRAEAVNQYTLTERLEQALTAGYRRYEGLYADWDTSRNGRRTVMCLARAAAVVELLADYCREQQISDRSYAPYNEVIDWLKQDRNYDYYFPKGCQYLPTHPVKLKEKVLELTIGPKPDKQPRQNNPLPIQEVIYRPRVGNANRDEFKGDAELMAWLTMARMHATNDPNAYVIRKIKEVCEIQGRDVPSTSWFSQHLASAKMKQLTDPYRHGSDSPLARRWTHSITMARAMYAGDCWMMDATRVNFVEHATTDDPKKKRFLVVIAVRDAYSGDIVGIHFDTKEDRWGYTNALKMAVKATGYLPHTLVHDRFPGHLTDEMKEVLGNIERKGVHLVCTHKATGKALLERWFDTLQTVFLTQSRYYYGEGIRSTREYAHRSPEYLLKLRKEANRNGWDFDTAWQEAWRCIELYRQTPISHYSPKRRTLHQTPQQLHAQCEKPNVIKVEVWEEADLFWLTKVLQVNSGVKFEVYGQDRNYAIYDHEVLYRYRKVAVRYDEADASSVLLFALDADDKPTSFLIGEYRLTTDVVIYGPDADPAQLAKRQALGKRVRDAREADLDEILRGADQSPEYFLAMGGRLSKDALESAESAILYEQMAYAEPTPAVARRPKAPPRASVPLNVTNLISY